MVQYQNYNTLPQIWNFDLLWKTMVLYKNVETRIDTIVLKFCRGETMFPDLTWHSAKIRQISLPKDKHNNSQLEAIDGGHDPSMMSRALADNKEIRVSSKSRLVLTRLIYAHVWLFGNLKRFPKNLFLQGQRFKHSQRHAYFFI